MKKIIILCNTYFQVLTAIQIKLKFYEKDKVIFLLSDHSKNTKLVAQKIEQLNLFSRVCYLETKNKYVDRNRSFTRKLFNLYSIIFGDNLLSADSTLDVDELLFFNIDTYTYSLFASLYKFNRNLKCIKFEESVISYNIPQVRGKLSLCGSFVRKYLLFKKNLLDSLNDFYCYSPELYQGKLNAIKIPKIDCDELKTIIENLFDINLSVYRYKYIFFTSVYDFDSICPIGEFEVLKQIRDFVGNDNLLVKVHPRDRRDVFIKEGFNLDPNNSVPWEAILISARITNCVLLSVNSSCLFASNIIENLNCVSAFVYPLCRVENDPTAFITIKNIESLLNNELTRKWGKIKILEKLDDILELK